MIVYRIAHKRDFKQGLYCALVSSQMYELDGPHPGPWRDARLSNGLRERGLTSVHGWRFGFKNLDQLRQWVYSDEWRRRLADEGYVCYELEVPDAIIGDCQCVFQEHCVLRVVLWSEINE